MSTIHQQRRNKFFAQATRSISKKLIMFNSGQQVDYGEISIASRAKSVDQAINWQ